MKLVFRFVIFLCCFIRGTAQTGRNAAAAAAAVAMKCSSKINSNNDDVITLAVFSVEIYRLRLCERASVFVLFFCRLFNGPQPGIANFNETKARVIFGPVDDHEECVKWNFMIEWLRRLLKILQFCAAENEPRALGGLEIKILCAWITTRRRVIIAVVL